MVYAIIPSLHSNRSVINCFNFLCDVRRTKSPASHFIRSLDAIVWITYAHYIITNFSIRLYLKIQFINISQCATGFCLNNKAKQP